MDSLAKFLSTGKFSKYLDSINFLQLLPFLAGIPSVALAWWYLRPAPLIDLQKRIVLITGCDSGLGLGTVKALASRGAIILAVCYTEEGLLAASEAGAKHVIQADLSKPEEIVTLAA